MKKIYKIFLSLILLLTFGFLSWFFLFDKIMYVSLDVNPSVQIGLNRLHRVVSVESFNSEGKSILDNVFLLAQTDISAIKKIIKEASESNYIKKDGSTDMMVTIATNDEASADSLTDKIDDLLDGEKTKVTLFKKIVDMNFYGEANELDISIGKLSLIKQLIEKDKTLTVGSLKDKSLEAIITAFNEYYDSNPIETDTTSGATPVSGGSINGNVDTTSKATSTTNPNNNTSDDGDYNDYDDDEEEEYEDD